MYQVYSVDTCFSEYAMEYVLVGAESENDLISHLGDFIQYKKDVKRIIKDQEDGVCRIREIENLFTDVPYTVLDCFGYYE